MFFPIKEMCVCVLHPTNCAVHVCKASHPTWNPIAAIRYDAEMEKRKHS